MAASPMGTALAASLANVQRLDLSGHAAPRVQRDLRHPGAPEARAAMKGQQPCIVWLTGLSGAGKSTIAALVEQRLLGLGRHPYVLDGDEVRHGLNRDLGFSLPDRLENARRLAEVARLMADAGLIVLVAAISPARSQRAFARTLVPAGRFFEVFVDAPLRVAEQRDPRGLYLRARQGVLRDVAGIHLPYESPDAPELRLDTTQLSADEAAARVIDRLRDAGVLGPLAAA